MKKIRIIPVLLIALLAFAACSNPAGGGGGGSGGGGGGGWGGGSGDARYWSSAIQGVTPPAVGETPVTEITPTAQYTGTVKWSPSHQRFLNSTIYFATITLTPKSGYTMEGVPTDFFTVTGANKVNNDADSGIITAIFPTTAGTIASPAVIDIPAIEGITPISRETPKTVITPTAQYTGTVEWSPSDNPFEVFRKYKATITLTPKAGFTLTGVKADFFKVMGANTVSYKINSSTVTADFTTSISINDLESYLFAQPANTVSTPYFIALKLAYYYDTFTLGTILKKIPDRYVNLDLSGSSTIEIPGSGFRDCTSLISVIIPNSVTSIYSGTFHKCTNLTSVTIPNSVTNIENNAFSNCTSLTSVTIPNSVINIEPAAFSNCTSLASVTIGNSVTSIGQQAFGFCTNLTSVNIPDSVFYIGQDAFYNTAWWNNLVDQSKPVGVVYVGKIAIYYHGTMPANTSIVFLDDTKGILYSFFPYLFSSDNTDLVSVTIPDSVISIGHYAFYRCANLTSVTFQGTITSDNFGSYSSFRGDLRTKYFAAGGGIGTYKTTAPVSSDAVWVKQ